MSCHVATMSHAHSLPKGVLKGNEEPLGSSADLTIVDPINSKLSQAIENTSGELKATLVKVRRMRSWARMFGWSNALAALDHYLEASGRFVEIPISKVQSVRRDAESDHKEKLLFKIQRDMPKLGWSRPVGARTVLALDFLYQGDRVLSENHWPKRAVIHMDYASGVARSGINDDNLAYYGSTIQSEVQIACVRKEGTRCYELTIVDWKSWVVDNYDWEGEKQFGSSLFNPVRPTQRQMRELAVAGYARAYQRSSRSWSMENRATSWTECFENDEVVLEDAKYRKLTRLNRIESQSREARGGALPTPRPAEEIIKR